MGFQHVTLSQKVIGWISRNCFEDFRYTSRRGLTKGMKRCGGLGWIPSRSLSMEEKFWMHFPLAKKTVFDIGAFDGRMTLFFARYAKNVVSFEPDPINRAKLVRHIELNKLQNVTVHGLAVGSRSHKIGIAHDFSSPGMSHVVPGEHAVGELVEIVALDELVDLPAPDVIKIDTEGYELEVLRGAKELIEAHKPEIVLENHGQTMAEKCANMEAIVNFLNGIGYCKLLHIESDTSITPENIAVAAEGHLYCRAI